MKNQAGLFAQHGALRVSENKRFLEHQDGTPFFYLGDTAWELFHRLSREEADYYLENRARKGFTVIQAVLLAECDGTTDPNAYGELPLIDNDPSRPNDAYFEHVDYIVKRAEELGMLIGMLPCWGRYWKIDSNKQANPGIFTPENAEAYCRYVAKRYRHNALIWILGGDRSITSDQERAIIDAMGHTLRKHDPNHLITFHPRGPGMSTLELGDASWLDFNMSQSSHAGRNHDSGLFIERDLLARPARPTLDGEPRYEGIPVGFYFNGSNPMIRFDDYDVRQTAWWNMLAGACGHTYGNANIWQMYAPGRSSVLGANVPWYDAVDEPGARQMGIMRRCLESRPFTRLVPVTDLILDGPICGGAKIRSALAKDGSFAVVYSPMGEAFTLDKTKLSTSRVRCSWVDPRYGSEYHIHTGENRGIQTYTPPTSGRGFDWVLVLEDEEGEWRSAIDETPRENTLFGY